MKTQIGLWVDHRQAVVVAFAGKGEATTLVIKSKVEKQPGRLGGKRSTERFEAQQVPADDRRQRRFMGQLDIYYDAVIACVRKADSIVIFGPGEAKGELRKRLLKAGVRGCVEEAETADKMTERQIVAKVRQHFAAG